MGFNAVVQDSLLLLHHRHQNKAGHCRASALSRPKRCTHWFGVDTMHPASVETKGILAAQHTGLYPSCNSPALLRDLDSNQSGFLQPSELGSEMNTPPFSPHLRPHVLFLTSFSLCRCFTNMKKPPKTKKARRSPSTERVQS